MKLGADPKRLAILGALVLVGGYVFYSNVFSNENAPALARPGTTARVANVPTPVNRAGEAPTAADRGTDRSRARDLSRSAGEWNPAIGGSTADPMKVDPTIRFDLLAKVQKVDVSSAQRNLFQYGAAPPPLDKSPIPNPGKIVIKGPPVGPAPPPPQPAEPTAPPIPLKYYGYTHAKTGGPRRAFFLDNDEIIVASEGEMVKHGRYKLVKIGVNSVTMEDTQFKSQQTLPLAPDAAG